MYTAIAQSITMETKSAWERREEKKTLQMMAGSILEAQRELDDLALQLSLGKVAAMDKFEEIKGGFRQKVAELKLVLEDSPGDLPMDVRKKIVELEVQLAVGRAESKEKFTSQQRKILAAINHVENELRIGISKVHSPHFFVHEVEIFRLKLEILKLKVGLRKFEVKDEFRQSMAAAKKEITRISKGVRTKLDQGKEKYIDISEEIATTYRHLKRAIEKL